MATLANRNICEYKRKPQVSSPTVSQNGRLCWGKLKSGVTLGLDHLLVFNGLLCLLLYLWALHRSYIDPNPDLGYILFR